ncbi:MAG TPA: tRNA (guanosine(46)-N7)-methyltransferase TrmB [Chthoniobacterales bacterium]|nr:tRNA (guanosine(46)-N7)-methyltransferase TrmB [Chthoniobacterales bacterium]
MVELVPQTYFAQLNLVAVFGREAPLQVDLGCGDGGLICELARKFPEKNFLGLEKLVGRVAKTCRKSAELENVRVLNVESAYAVRYLLPENSVETFYLLFPDPWPKRRHHRRRVVTADFLTAVHRALNNEGILHIATDQENYFQQIHTTVEGHPGLESIGVNGHDLPSTKFERRFVEAGAPIYRLSLRKISPVT